MLSPGSLAKVLPPSGLRLLHLALVLGSSLLAGFWLYSWMQGEPDAYANQHARGFTLAVALLLIGFAQLAKSRSLRNTFLAGAGASLLASFLLA